MRMLVILSHVAITSSQPISYAGIKINRINHSLDKLYHSCLILTSFIERTAKNRHQVATTARARLILITAVVVSNQV